jgi:hypothetical protein
MHATLQHYETKNSSTFFVLYLMIHAKSRGEPINKVGAREILYNFVSMSQVQISTVGEIQGKE